jgi:hypothetical protein
MTTIDADTGTIVNDRLVRDGKVAVLYSPGFGAGWSTWQHDPGVRMAMLFDPQIADIVDRGGSDWQERAEAVASIKYPESYLGGLHDLQVEWVPIGTDFRVTEYDGNETVEFRDQIDWVRA